MPVNPKEITFEPSTLEALPVANDIQNSLSSNESRITVKNIDFSTKNEEMKLNISYGNV